MAWTARPCAVSGAGRGDGLGAVDGGVLSTGPSGAGRGGRRPVNVPIDTTMGGNRPTYAQLVAAALAVGLRYKATIRWVDGHLGKSVARGSVDSATAPNVIAPCETVLVASKGAWRRPARTS